MKEQKKSATKCVIFPVILIHHQTTNHVFELGIDISFIVIC